MPSPERTKESGKGGNSGGRVNWDDLFSHVCVCTGWTWDQVGDLTLPRLKALQYLLGGCSRSHFYNLVNAGEIPGHRYGRVKGLWVWEGARGGIWRGEG